VFAGRHVDVEIYCHDFSYDIVEGLLDVEGLDEVVLEGFPVDIVGFGVVLVGTQGISFEELTKDLHERWQLPPQEAKLLAAVSGGRPGIAYHYHENKVLKEKRIKALNDHVRLISASRVERFRFSEGINEDVKNGRMTRQDLYEMLATWLSLWRDVLLTAAGSERMLTNPDRQEEITALADRYQLQGAQKNVLAVEKTLERLRKNVNLRLAMDVLLLDLSQSDGSTAR